jgi:UDP-N-acetylmuramoylalanine--D-glutamate ligase
MTLAADTLCGLKVAIIGAAREGTALAQYLVAQGAVVTLSDTKPAAALQKRLAPLQGLPLRLALGGYPADLLEGLDVLFLSPGVPPEAPLVREARARGLPISSEPRLFTQLCAVPVVGITGSSGKTTTTTLTGKMYAAERPTWVGGNIGLPLLEKMLGAERRASTLAERRASTLAERRASTLAVLELSSFQLELFSPAYQGETTEERRSAASRVIATSGWSPHIAAITNITPNHLDRHPSMADYIAAKAIILAYQRAEDWAVLNLDNDITRDLATRAQGRVAFFSLEQPVDQGAFLHGETLVLRWGGQEQPLCTTGEIKLRGAHNVANTLAAACCARAGGVSVEAIRHVATTFTGVDHRLEVVRTWRGALYINDSIATSPERAMAALRAYREPLVLLAGGRDKHLPWDEWAELVQERVRAVIAFGEAVPIITQALAGAGARRTGARPEVHQVATLEEAVRLAAQTARAGEVVLLSPGGTSFDAFEDFEARGQRFRELVQGLGEATEYRP